ncbi:MAG: sigma-70 family RNA polymerase sigma factor [Sedimentisphaerales bacterium]|nr:sigma-70 family RNA polymerase sigma factor [Sedimentisphaerales bacterium]
MAMLEDKVLLWRLRRGSTRALSYIYSKYENDLLSLAVSLLGRADRAEDVLQDVFTRFIETLDAFELTGSLKGYLAKCVANRSRDILRRDRHRVGAPLETASHVESRQDDPLQRAINDEESHKLREALQQLPREQQEAVLLHLQVGLKFRDVADVQGVSAKTTESRYRYGISRLRSMLNGQVEP